MNFEHDFNWAKQYDSLIKSLVQPHLGQRIQLIDADEMDDCQRATDAIGYAQRTPIAIRIRRPSSYRDITIRTYRPSGLPTEGDKLCSGYVAYYFYGWTSEPPVLAFDDWILFDVERFCNAGFLREAREIPNNDGSAKFKAIAVAHLWDEPLCVIASSTSLEPPNHLRLFPPAARSG